MSQKIFAPHNAKSKLIEKNEYQKSIWGEMQAQQEKSNKKNNRNELNVEKFYISVKIRIILK